MPKIKKELKDATFIYDEEKKCFCISDKQGKFIELNKVYAFALVRFVVRISQRNWLKKNAAIPKEIKEEIQEDTSLNSEIEDILNNEFNEESVVEEVVEEETVVETVESLQEKRLALQEEIRLIDEKIKELIEEPIEKSIEKLAEKNMLGRLAKSLKLNETGKQKLFDYFEKGELQQ